MSYHVKSVEMLVGDDFKSDLIRRLAHLGLISLKDARVGKISALDMVAGPTVQALNGPSPSVILRLQILTPEEPTNGAR